MKKWIKVSRGPNGPRMVTVTLQDGHLTAKNTVKALASLKSAAKEAEDQARGWLAELKEIES